MVVIGGGGAKADRHVADLTARGYEVMSIGVGGERAHPATIDHSNKAALLREFASALDLPDWFGHNLDALLDALRDLESSDGRPVALVWHGTLSLRRRDRQLYDDVLDILEQVDSERDDLRVTLVDE